MIVGIPLKSVDRSVLAHTHERRGFVTVPLDPDDTTLGTSNTIDIFWRMLPPHGSTCDDTTKPIIVVINGGPGIPSSYYRPLDWDYSTNLPKHAGDLDRFKYILQTHRVILADQRGTDGCSAPLDMDDATLDAHLVARYFSSDAHARDYAAVIDHVVPADEPFWIIAQSYGGMPGMQYLALAAAGAARRPRGIVFSSSALPYEDVLAANLSRRAEQLRLNQQLAADVPGIVAKIAATRAHLAAEGLDPDRVNGLFGVLGELTNGAPAIVQRLDALLGQTKDQILAEATAHMEEPSLLNYILSCVNFTAGWTDRALANLARASIPFDDWMIDETWVLLQTGMDGSWRERLVDGLDTSPPPATAFPTLAALRAAIAQNQVLHTVADDDAMVPAESYRKAIAKFLVDGHSQVVTIPGGHTAVFLAAGHRALLAWMASV